MNAGFFALRVGMGIVFLLFGFDKLVNPAHWLIFIPSFLTNIAAAHPQLNAYGFLRIQGIVEGFLGIQFLLGVLTRLTACGAALILALIIYFIGLDPVGIRDLGLLFGAVAILFLGPGKWSVDAWLIKWDKKNQAIDAADL